MPARFKFASWHKEAQGFTLVELLIVVSIMTIITGAIIPSFSTYIRNQTLKQAQEQIKSDLRTAQNKALTGALSDQSIGGSPVAYWAIRFKPGSGQGSNQYDFFVSANNTSCPSSFVSGQLQESLSISTELQVKTTNDRCVFFSIANGEISTVNFGGSAFVILGYTGTSASGNCMRVLFNTQGMIYSNNNVTCT